MRVTTIHRCFVLAVLIAGPLAVAACTSGATPNCADAESTCDPYGDGGGQGVDAGDASDATTEGAVDSTAVDTGNAPETSGGDTSTPEGSPGAGDGGAG